MTALWKALRWRALNPSTSMLPPTRASSGGSGRSFSDRWPRTWDQFYESVLAVNCGRKRRWVNNKLINLAFHRFFFTLNAVILIFFAFQCQE
jgi:hypothetical protein